MKIFYPNPFKFGDPVEGDFYLPRPELTKTVRQFLENHIHVVLIGPRRFGKTSFVLNLLKELESSSHSCLFIDIFNITSHKDFLQQILRALNEKKSWIKKIMELIPRFRPKMSAEIDLNTGKSALEVGLDISVEKDAKDMIQDVLASLEKMGESVILVIDEFQKICEIDDRGWLEATLRTHMQRLKNVTFLFTGSRKRMIYDMLNNPARPLYRSCQPIEFPSLGSEFTDWIAKRFSDLKISCDHQAIEHLKSLVQNTPNYIQMICFHMVALGKNPVNILNVEETLQSVVRQNAYAYQTLLSSLTPTQQRVLRLAAKEGKQIFAKELLNKYEISSAPAMSSALKSLKDKGIIDEEGTHRGNVIFDDPFFALWLKNM